MEELKNNLHRQMGFAHIIETTKQKEWLTEAKKYIPAYAAEYLFYPKTSVLSDMLKRDPEKGFKYDPEVLFHGLDTVIQILRCKNSPTSTVGRAQHHYSNFADAETRVEYLRKFIEQLELYPIVGKQVIADLREVAKTSTDPEFLEFLEPRIKNIEYQLADAESQNKHQREF